MLLYYIHAHKCYFIRFIQQRLRAKEGEKKEVKKVTLKSHVHSQDGLIQFDFRPEVSVTKCSSTGIQRNYCITLSDVMSCKIIHIRTHKIYNRLKMSICEARCSR